MCAKRKMVLNIEVTAVEPVAVGPMGYGYEKSLKKNDNPSKITGLPRFGRSYLTETPRYLQASTLRHVLREQSSVFVTKTLADAGKPLPISSVMALVSGYTESSGKKKAKKGEEDSSTKKATHLEIFERNNLVREKNPLIDLFGFSLGMGGSLRVGNLFPRPVDGHPSWHIYNGYVRKPLPESALNTAEPDGIAGYFDMLDRQSNKGESDSNNGLKNVGGAFEEFLPGTIFDQRITLVQGDLFRLGLIMVALEAFSDDPVIGAHRGLGRGLVFMQGELSDTEGNHGSFTLSEGDFQVTGLLEEALNAVHDAADQGFPDHDFSLLPFSNGEDN